MTIPFPTPDDPVIVTGFDSTFFVCWIDVRVDVPSGALWFAQTSDGRIRTVGAYGRESTLEQIRERVDAWWRGVRSPTQH
jgi:hypothetical protein